MGICFMGNFLLIIYIAVSLNKMVQYFFPQKDPVPMSKNPQKDPVPMSKNTQKDPVPMSPMSLLIIFTIIVVITIAVIIFIFFTFSHNKHLRFN